MWQGCRRLVVALLLGWNGWLWTGLAYAAEPTWPAAYHAAYQLHKLDGKPLVLEIGAAWCPACPAAKKTMKAVEKELGREALFVYLDYDLHAPAKAATAGLSIVLPYVVIYDGVGEPRHIAGSRSLAAYRAEVRAAVTRAAAAK